MKTSILACLPAFFYKKNQRRNKNDKRGIVVRNKARLVAHGSTQEEGLDYEEVFALVARIEAMRLFLAYASFIGFMVYQMDVKSAFLYGTIEEEVYVCQPLGFKDPDYPEKGKIDKTLFIKKQKGDILLVQVYVDDIIFGSTNKYLCKAFEKLTKDKFQMSSMGELTFFLGLQVKQKADGILINQDKYVAKILRKFSLTDRKSASTPIDTKKPLLKDPDGKDVDVHTYKSMIGSLMYLTSSRPDIMFVVCACACFQVTPKALHLHAVKRIFRYLKGKPHLGLWYPKDLPFNLVAYSDSDYAVVATSSTEAEYAAAASWLCLGAMDSKSIARLWVIQSSMRLLERMLHVSNQTISGKDTSNPLMADNLPKIVWYSTHHVALMKSWLVQKQTALGKDESNPFIVDSLLKTIWLIVTAVSLKFLLFALRLDDAESIDCLPNEEIFIELLRMGYEKPSTKLTFYKEFFSPQWKFLIHTLLQYMSAKRTSWKEFSSFMALAVICLSTGKGFSRVETPLSKGMIVAQQADDVADEVAAGVDVDDVPAADAEPTLPSPTTQPPPPKELPSTSQVVPTPPPSPIAQPSSPSQQQQPSPPTTVSMDLLQILLKTYATLTRRVENLEQDKIVQALEIIKLKKRVNKLEKRRKLRVFGLKRLRKVGTTQRIESFADTVMDDQEDASKQGAARRRKGVVIRDPEETATPSTIIHTDSISKDKGKEIMVEEPKPLKKQAQIKQDEAYARELELEEEESRALKRQRESLEEKAVKKQKLDEEVPVVDYEIYSENNKPFYKIIRADRSHQLFLSCLSLLRNFDREDLEMLSQLVKERFASSKPKNFSDDFLLTTLTYMFEKPDVEAHVWNN
uniref:Reverse transcriptase Ty1/copia-type domain-containing protein n=1 Tax=Tanacetum cinerariifolium TaxID=118510 RepID=A0A6L2NV03_TANCI|nr:hypothetical protein [Tanacetum cinerariifolium]GEU91907.1 hypothetical protein [Tanacetum cinerariifolium]